MLTLYGIKNCDSVKKARKWLEARNLDYRFHDFREDGLDSQQAASWIAELGWETLINRRSTTWKQLPEAVRASLNSESALAQVIDQPTLIKRPLLDTGRRRHVGFKEADYQALLDNDAH